VPCKENQLGRIAEDMKDAGQRKDSVEIEKQSGQRNENTDEPKPATVSTISEKSAIRKNKKTNIEMALLDVEQALERKQKMTSL
jgi:hypothetical protein